jgi:hypothetical protein
MNKNSNFKNIKSKELKKDIVAALADDTSKAILDSSIYESKTVEDIIIENKIPRTSAYRKVDLLLSQKLLVIEKIERSRMKESRFFITRFTNIKIKYRNGLIDIEVVPNKKICKMEDNNF